ncbi:MFS transporter [Corynebacterium caspium]|uniref:MFS transporter n=1 Tax=Corynebacterium caspium TaxID=234828 RepID=UPI0003A1035C|nr:MFS transporter [Corynebacterium caspium]
MWQISGYIPTLIAVACAFGAWSLLLPVVPTAVLDSGGGEALAGATTGIFMATTVLTQIFTPAALRRWGYTPVMVVAASLLGVPALGHLFGMTAVPALLFSAIRGVGFGALSVSDSALIAEIVPVRLLGKATGMLGVFIGFSQMIFLPLGLAIAHSSLGFNAVYIIAAIVALIAGFMCLRIPRLYPAKPEVAGENRLNSPRVATWKLVTVPAIAMATIAMSFGAISSFLPVAVRELDPHAGVIIGGVILSIVGGVSMLFRYLSGMVADRLGRPGSTMIIGQVLGFFGALLLALTLQQGWSIWPLVLGSIFFGAGFGFVQNESLLFMFSRLPRTQISAASALWNGSYDAGTGVGSFALGAVAAYFAYQGAFGAGALLIFFGLVVTLLDYFMGKHRITPYGNTRARLRNLRTIHERSPND